MSFAYNIQNGLWLVLKVGRAFVGPENERNGGRDIMYTHTYMYVHSHIIWVMFVLYSGL